ncbi:3'-phosphoadenosine 5'-phosphate phosphatase [Frankia sp. AiPs1]|uniref:3'(2'),5'-bisphosphate nucleotidase CysQ n=1 Tax=Frankia sp. AiPa1 TaxID=573492 RepID=UPI00202ADDAB|nr:3'(2'),5'-bisphosphate nucleotidase CysQ [Frankia sp. AiPa1]MCL9758050.1 3'(2'),5'-bisphosphate nucleotidase CysQ [Frankia sp. AiPa1]
MNTDDTSSPARVPVDIATDELDDDVLARRLATDAGKLLLRIRDELGFAEPATLRDAGDARSHQLLARALARHRPADAVLSEEGVDDPARLSAERVWIVDPLDGTREFAEPGRSDWAVHVALWQRGELVSGAVALPALGVTLPGAEGPPTAQPVVSPPRIVASRTRAPLLVGQVAETLGATIVPMGSAGAKAAAVIRGQAEIYLHAGGQYEWDSAAPVAVARAAGLHTSRLDGSPLRYNQPDPLLPDLVICAAPLASVVLAAIAAAGG